MIEYSIPPLANLFMQAFGVKIGGIYRPEQASGNPDDPTGFFTGVEVVEDINQAYEMSAMGTPILFPVLFSSGVYKKYNERGEIVDKKMGDFRLPIASIVSFRRDKIMGVTRINGGNGTVKEIYGFDDWQVSINGFLIPDGSQPQGFKNPLEQERELVKWDNLASSIEVFGELFTVRKIKRLTIKSISFEPMRGKPNIRTFTITAISDDPIELNIKSRI
ncbi:DUF6046 domain-containing protein [Flavobacterium laiguense]|uniref:DUF6046 domain-containing protein n=1 Tax=Flavobacterium laiguense TaxID=2169409 RepID=A0A2U1K149_9FLAO|nr:DUF6046 domain-containing protein [Flavobacterium laiguense]PWA10975.1 hypothetical protein DB891_03850 [Flavobacterium laiguense]